MPKYRDYFRKMTEENQELFQRFTQVHARYAQSKSTWQAEFNEVGEEVMEVIREWEGRLCGRTERGNNAVFSGNLAEKFWGEIKAFWPLIDFVGVEVVVMGKDGGRTTGTQSAGSLERGEQVKVAIDEDADMLEIEKLGSDDEVFELKKLV